MLLETSLKKLILKLRKVKNLSLKKFLENSVWMEYQALLLGSILNHSQMKTKMTDHIVTTLHQLLTTYPRAGIMGGGDRNDWNIETVLHSVPHLQNLLQKATLNGKNQDVFISNLGPYYASSVVVPPADPDDPSKGKRSDHSVPILYPLDNHSTQKTTEYRERTTRPLHCLSQVCANLAS